MNLKTPCSSGFIEVIGLRIRQSLSATTVLPLFLVATLVQAQGNAIPSFSDLCVAPGVVSCEGFENASDVDPYIVASADKVIRATLDNTFRATGSSSLRFEIPGRTSSNAAGSWMAPMGDGFGQGEKFYVLFKQRFSPEMLDKSLRQWGNGWKQVIFHKKGSSCGGVELTTQNIYSRFFPQMYTSCGARQFTIQDNTGLLLQQGDYNCYYGNYNSNDCGFYRANEWMVFYWEIEIGAWGTNTSRVRAYMAYEGQPLRRFIDVSNFKLNFNDSPADTYSRIQITPYATNKNKDVDHPTAYTWYDDLVISTLPIPYPTVSDSVTPNAPSDLAVD